MPAQAGIQGIEGMDTGFRRYDVCFICRFVAPTVPARLFLRRARTFGKLVLVFAMIKSQFKWKKFTALTTSIFFLSSSGNPEKVSSMTRLELGQSPAECGKSLPHIILSTPIS